jgi:hypothetical protein
MAQAGLADFLSRFAEFESVDTIKINGALAEASLFTDTTWGEAEALGSMLYAAHALSSQGLGSGAASAASSNSGIKSRSSGSHKIEYTDTANGIENHYFATPYRRQFAQLRLQVSVPVLSVR